MKKVIIIAEAGVNHNGQLDLAKKLIDAAVAAGSDLVKFQTFNAKELVSKFAKKAEYQLKNATNAAESQLQMLQKLELSEEEHQILIEYCKIKNIQFFSTAFDLGSLEYLARIGLEFVKIPSGEMTNLPYLRKAASLFRKVILSTGMASVQEIQEALQVFLDSGIPKESIIVLHCNTEYPTPMRDVNLRAMQHIKEIFGVEVGYSDHTLGIEVPIAAVALGAIVIEKHLTLDRNMDGPDHKASLEPDELKTMVSAIRNIELAIGGDGLKSPSQSEKRNLAIARKSIVAATKISKGTKFTAMNLTVKRPGIGISPMQWDTIIDTYATKDYEEDDLI